MHDTLLLLSTSCFINDFRDGNGRVWDGSSLPHFRPCYIIFFSSPFQTRGELVTPCPFIKELIISSPSHGSLEFQLIILSRFSYLSYKEPLSKWFIFRWHSYYVVSSSTFNQAFVVQQNCKMHRFTNKQSKKSKIHKLKPEKYKKIRYF